VKWILLSFLIIISLLFNTVSISTGSRLSTVDDEPDFVLIGDPFTSILQPGVLRITATIMNNGSAAAIPEDVSITWEDLYYELVLDNGTGMLNETDMDHDLDGDGDKTAMYNVIWFHDVNRQWDAVINGSNGEKHVYSLWEGPPESPWSNLTRDINGTSKLFQLGNQTHVLYGADNDTARFGFGAVTMIHPGPHLELEVTSSTSAVSTMIDGNPVEVNHTGTRKVYSEGNWSTTTRYIISSQEFELGAGKQVSIALALMASEATTAYLGLFMNWSPDGDTRRNWKLHEAAVSIQAMDRPFFWTRDYDYTKEGTGEIHFNATVINSGLTATAGTVQTSQEDVIHTIYLEYGAGMLNESEVGEIGMDLNGDGDQTDTFNVTSAPSSTREVDVTITDGTTEIHAYAICEEWYGEPYPHHEVRNYSINGQSKVFQLGSENHLLDLAYPLYDFARFGLNAVVLDHPSPNFEFIVSSTGIDSLDNLTVEDFKINGKAAELNYSGSPIYSAYDFDPGKYKLYIVSSPGLEITTGEQVTFSCTINATSNVTFYTDFFVNWSPDGIQRYIYWTVGGESGLTITWPYQPPPDTTPTTTPTSDTSTTTTPPVTGFTFLAPAALAVPIVLSRRRRKRD
jgi:hypothetical protein